MDLIYMNSKKEDVGVLMNYSLDLAFGADENNFECRINSQEHCCKEGFYLYFEDTEYGGVIDAIGSDTSQDEVIYSGRTWQGILASKVIMPLVSGEGSTGNVTVKTEDANNNSMVDRYLVISGSVKDCIRFILDRVGLNGLFSVTDGMTATISSFQFDRFTDAYSGLVKMLKSVDAKLHMVFQEGMVVLSAVQRYDYSQDEEFDSDNVDLQLTKRYKTVNHLICLGSGELENRIIIHLYADASGKISKKQSQFGTDEYTAVYDYPNAESEADLESGGIDRLKELWATDELSIQFGDNDEAYDVGDIVGAIDNITGLVVSAEINKKIITIENDEITISYEVGE